MNDSGKRIDHQSMVGSSKRKLHKTRRTFLLTKHFSVFQILITRGLVADDAKQEIKAPKIKIYAPFGAGTTTIPLGLLCGVTCQGSEFKTKGVNKYNAYKRTLSISKN